MTRVRSQWPDTKLKEALASEVQGSEELPNGHLLLDFRDPTAGFV